MTAIGQALWYIESHFGGPVTLDAVAAAVGLSRFHLSRSFAHATGRSFTAHLRGRRLTEAARALAGGAPDILAVALEAGYGSHEAFTRAFRDQFGLTPEAVRARRSLTTLALVEPLTMPDTPTADIAPVAIRTTAPLLIAGMRRFFAFADRGGIPALWQRFAPHVGQVPGEIAGTAYGVCLAPAADAEGTGFDYLAGVAVASLDDLPTPLVGVRIPASCWAVFAHHDHVSGIGATCAAAAEWLARSGRRPADGAVPMIEAYGPAFDPRTGLGGCEVWLPVAG